MRSRMEPKDIVQKAYDCFASGDMETFASLWSDDAVIVVNGMHKFSGTYNGVGDWIANMLAHMPTHFPGLEVVPLKMVEEDGHVFIMASVKAEGLDSLASHYDVIEEGKIKEFHIFDDSQKLAHAMKAV